MPRIGWKAKFRLYKVNAWALNQASQEAAALAATKESFGLCFNACVLARAIYHRGRPVFSGGDRVLEALSAEEVADYTQRYLARFVPEEAVQVVNPQFDQERFKELQGR